MHRNGARTVLRGGGAGNSTSLPDVRHEVADVAVLLSAERTDSTCCSASSILPGRACQGRRVRSSRQNVASSHGRAAQAQAVTATASSKVVGNQDRVVKVNPGEASSASSQRTSASCCYAWTKRYVARSGGSELLRRR